MFDTPVGGAFLLALIFSLIGLYLLVLFIMDGIKSLFKPPVDYAALAEQRKREIQDSCLHKNKTLNRPRKDSASYEYSDKEWYCYDCQLVWEEEPSKDSTHTQTHQFDDIRMY